MKKADPYYKSKHWKDLRAERLRLDMYTCVVPGCNTPAYAVDHVIARRDGGADRIQNLRSLCKMHDHKVKEGRDGKRGNNGLLGIKGCFVDGSPRDPMHPWFTGGPKAGAGSNNRD